MERYSRHILLTEIGQKGQDLLSKAKVLVVGAGGLGCPALQYLSAAGIGTIGIIDNDTVSVSNLQRQILFGTSCVGINKAIAAKKRLEDLNNTIEINVYPIKLTHKNALELFQQYDIIVDGTDNFYTRYLINDASIITNKPLVYGAIHKFEGQVAVFNYYNGPSYRCLFPTPPKTDTIPNCSEIGVLGVLPGIIGSMQANEVLKIILGIGSPLTGKVLYYNALNTETTILSLTRSDDEIKRVLSDQNHFKNKEEESVCVNTIGDSSVKEITIREVLQLKNVQFIDVRELHEKPKVSGLHVTSIPLSALKENIYKVKIEKEKIVFCQQGIRSKKAAAILKEHGIPKVFSLKEGASELLKKWSQLLEI